MYVTQPIQYFFELLDTSHTTLTFFPPFNDRLNKGVTTLWPAYLLCMGNHRKWKDKYRKWTTNSSVSPAWKRLIYSNGLYMAPKLNAKTNYCTRRIKITSKSHSTFSWSWAAWIWCMYLISVWLVLWVYTRRILLIGALLSFELFGTAELITTAVKAI